MPGCGNVCGMLPRIGPGEETTSNEVPWLLVGLIVIHVLFGLLTLVWQAGKAWPIALLWAGACSLVGSTIGFLFGIPRTLQGDQELRRDTIKRSNQVAAVAGREEVTSEAHLESVKPAVSISNGETYQLIVNTNLEQISDWLTKILVGVGLTQINHVPSELMRAAGFIAKGLGNNQSQESLAVALLIYFPVLGFLSGYLCTRLFLQPAFRRWDRSFEPPTN